MSEFLSGVIAAAATTTVAGVLIIARTMFAMRRDVVKFSATIQAMARSQPYMLKGLRFQNEALREIGANGATEKADRCIDEAERVYDELQAALVGGETR